MRTGKRSPETDKELSKAEAADSVSDVVVHMHPKSESPERNTHNTHTHAESDRARRRDTIKTTLLLNFRGKCTAMQKHFQRKAVQWKQYDDLTDVILITLGGVVFSALVLDLGKDNHVARVISAACASISTVGQLVKRGIGVTRRWTKHQATANRYDEIARYIQISITRARSTDRDLSHILDDVNERMALVVPDEPFALDSRTEPSQR